MQVHSFAGSLVIVPPEPAPLVLLNEAARAAWEAAEGDSAAARLAPLLDGAPSIAPTRGCRQPQGHTAAESSAVPGADEGRGLYAINGALIDVRFRPESLQDLIEPRFGYTRTAGASAPTWALTVSKEGARYALRDRSGTIEVATPDALLGAFVRRVAEISFPGRNWLAVLHAAAVVDGSGRAILLPGPNGAGKSTLVAALLAAGYGYLSDDCCPVTEDGAVVPVPFAICLKEGAWRVATRYVPDLASVPAVGAGPRRCRFVPPPGDIATAAAPIVRIVFPSFIPEAATSLEPLHPVEVLSRLIAGRAWLSREPDNLARALKLLETIPAYALSYSEARDVLDFLSAVAAPVLGGGRRRDGAA